MKKNMPRLAAMAILSIMPGVAQSKLVHFQMDNSFSSADAELVSLLDHYHSLVPGRAGDQRASSDQSKTLRGTPLVLIGFDSDVLTLTVSRCELT